MFPRTRRLSRSDFSGKGALVGERRASPHFSALFPREKSGYAVVISKKTLKLSVARHRLKRRTLSALRKLDLPPALVIYPKASALKLPFTALCEELAALVGRKGAPR